MIEKPKDGFENPEMYKKHERKSKNFPKIFRLFHLIKWSNAYLSMINDVIQLLKRKRSKIGLKIVLVIWSRKRVMLKTSTLLRK